MNSKGFSLIELLGVFVVLALIALISFPIITDTIKEARAGADSAQEKLIIESAKLWVNDNTALLSDTVGDIYTLSISTLNEGGYLSRETIKNLTNNQEYSNSCVKITTLEHKYTYEFRKTC